MDLLTLLILPLIKLFFKFISWLFGWYINRPKLNVRIRQDDQEVVEGGLVFEVENQSDTVTSLSPVIDVSFLTLKRKTEKMIFDIREQDRSLQPYVAKTFSASPRSVQQVRAFSWFRCYTFRPARGAVAHIRIKNASLEEVVASQYWAEKLWFKLTGNVILKETSMTMDDYNARKRSQGPH